MGDEIGYHPTGKVFGLRGYGPFSGVITDRTLSSVHIRPGNVILVSTKLEGKEGRIILDNKDRILIEIDDRHSEGAPIASGYTQDKIVVSVYDGDQSTSQIVIVHSDRDSQYEVYRGPDFASCPMGIEGDIVYMLNDVNGSGVIAGFNVKTGHREPLYTIPTHFHVIGTLTRMRDGPLVAMIAGVTHSDNKHVAKVVSIPDGNPILTIEDKVINSAPAENGIFYTLSNGEHYFSNLVHTQYEGLKYRLNLTDNRHNVPTERSKIVASSSDGTSIWIRYQTYDETYFINYKQAVYQRQKSARNTV